MGKATPKSGKNNKKRRKINSNSYNKTGNATTTTKENTNNYKLFPSAPPNDPKLPIL